MGVFIAAYMEAKDPGIMIAFEKGSREACVVEDLFSASVDGLLYNFQGELGRFAENATELEGAFAQYIAGAKSINPATAFRSIVTGLVLQLDFDSLPDSDRTKIKKETYAALDVQVAKLYPAKPMPAPGSPALKHEG